MIRKTIANRLVLRALALFEEEGWVLRKVLTVHPAKRDRLADCDASERVVRIFPKLLGQGDPPLGRSLLHELLAHVLLQYGGTDLEERECEWWERTVWRQMAPELRERLNNMAEEA